MLKIIGLLPTNARLKKFSKNLFLSKFITWKPLISLISLANSNTDLKRTKALQLQAYSYNP